jgi:hypothetical protein
VLYHGEFLEVRRIRTFVSEVTSDLEHSLEPTNRCLFQACLGRYAEEELLIEVVMVRDEWLCSSSGSSVSEDWSLDLDESMLMVEISHISDEARSEKHSLVSFFVGDKIEISLSILDLLILESVEFLRKRSDGFCEESSF